MAGEARMLRSERVRLCTGVCGAGSCGCSRRCLWRRSSGRIPADTTIVPPGRGRGTRRQATRGAACASVSVNSRRPNTVRWRTEPDRLGREAKGELKHHAPAVGEAKEVNAFVRPPKCGVEALDELLQVTYGDCAPKKPRDQSKEAARQRDVITLGRSVPPVFQEAERAHRPGCSRGGSRAPRERSPRSRRRTPEQKRRTLSGVRRLHPRGSVTRRDRRQS